MGAADVVNDESFRSSVRRMGLRADGIAEICVFLLRL